MDSRRGGLIVASLLFPLPAFASVDVSAVSDGIAAGVVAGALIGTAWLAMTFGFHVWRWLRDCVQNGYREF